MPPAGGCGTATSLIAVFDTKADAEDGVLVLKHYNRHCYLGRGYTGIGPAEVHLRLVRHRLTVTAQVTGSP